MNNSFMGYTTLAIAYSSTCGCAMDCTSVDKGKATHALSSVERACLKASSGGGWWFTYASALFLLRILLSFKRFCSLHVQSYILLTPPPPPPPPRPARPARGGTLTP